MRKLWMAGMMLLVLLTGCGPALTEADVPFAGEMLDNLLEGFAERDYGKASRDFGTAMKEAITEEGFPRLLEELDGSLGTLTGKSFLSAGRTRASVGVLTVVTYKAEYSKVPDARIRVWISEKNGKRSIEGFLSAPEGEMK